MDHLASQLRSINGAAGGGAGASFDALKLKGALVELDVYVPHARAFIDDAIEQHKLRVLPREEVAMLVGDAGILALSGAYAPHVRAGQLSDLVIWPNEGEVRCVNKFVRDPARPPRPR